MTFDEVISQWRDNSDHINVHTSGSTGSPKEILLPKNFVRESALRTIDFFDIKSESRLHSCVDPDFIGGKMMAIRADIAGADFTFEKASNRPLGNISQDITLDLVAVVPSQMIHILENINQMPQVANFLIGGAHIPEELRLRIAKSGLTAYESYGMTETASHIALRKVEEKVTPFKALPGVRISKEVDGTLIICFKNGYSLHTNDIVDLISETEFYVKGRKDDIINSGAKKINPRELEEKLAGILLSPFYISGFPHEKWGESVVLILEMRKNELETFREREFPVVLKEMHRVLPGWMVPKEIFYVEKLVTTPNGKIKRIKDPSSLVFFAHDICRDV